MRTIKKLIIYTTIIGAVLFSIVVVFGLIYQDEVIHSVKTEINKQLNAEIKVQSIEFSLIPNFPLASVTLLNIVGFESKNYSTSPDTLFKFTEFSLSFNVIDILRDKYILKSISGYDGFIDLKINKKGIGNYEIIKTTSDSNSGFSVDLQSVSLKKCEVGFVDLATKDKYEFYFKNIIANGLITDVSVNTALYGSLKVNDLVFDETPYLKGEDAKVDLGVSVNLETGAVQVSRGFVTLRNNYQFDVKGKTYQSGFKYTFDADNLDLKEAESLIPQKHIKFIEAYNITGKADVFVEISRKENEQRPHIFGDFALHQGALTFRKTGETVSISSAKGEFDLGKLAQPKTTKIDVSQISLTTKEGSASGSFKLYNLRHPKFVLASSGNVNLLEITNLVDLGSGFSMDGLVDFDIQLKGEIQDLGSVQGKDIETFTGNASLEVKNAAFEIKGAPELSEINTHMELNKTKLVFTDLEGRIAKSKTTGFGQVDHWLAFVLGKKKAMDIKADLITEKLELDSWINSTEALEKEDVLLPDFITYRGKLEITEFENEALKLTNIKTNVWLNENRLEFKALSFSGFSGALKGDLLWRQQQNSHDFSGSVFTQNVKVDELLKSFNNFDQKEITSSQVKGNFNSKLVFEFSTNKKLEISKKSITLDGDVVILEGELIEYKMLYNIPEEIEKNKIVKIFVNMELFEERLHHVKFDTMSNHISIKNEMITIPYMRIHSSAMSIAMKGTHTFDNVLDYDVSFSLRHVLGKDEPIKDKYGYIKDDDRGNRMIYLHLYTKNGKVEVDLDKFGEDKGLAESTSKEVGVAKSVLKEELGFFKKDTSVVVTTEEETFDYSVDLGEFSDTIVADSTMKKDTLKQDSSIFKKLLKGKKKKVEDDDFEEFDFEDDDF